MCSLLSDAARGEHAACGRQIIAIAKIGRPQTHESLRLIVKVQD